MSIIKHPICTPYPELRTLKAITVIIKSFGKDVSQLLAVINAPNKNMNEQILVTNM